MHKSQIRFWILWVIFHTGIFIAGFLKQKNDPGLALLNKLQYSVWSSRGAGLNLAITSSLIMLPMCRNTMGMLRKTFLSKVIPFDETIFFHKVCAWTILFFSLVHGNAHYVNFFNVEFTRLLPVFTWQIHYTMWGGITGHIMVIIMFLMYTTAAVSIRQKSFEAFWYIHHLAIIWYLCFFFHAYGCFVHTNKGECRPYYSWSYALFVCTIYFCERVYREIRGRYPTTIERVVMHPGNALEIRFNKPSMNYESGQYVFLCLPEISGTQWHPFTLTSCPEERHISVHIRVVGDWTSQAAQLLDSPGRDPRTVTLRVDGPYHAPTDRAFTYDHAILVGAGIGVTPFASILKSMYFKYKNQDPTLRLRKVDFFWINRDKEAFEWFQAELANIENMFPMQLLNFHLFLTEKLDLSTIHNYCVNASEEYDPITALRSQLNFGRPNWDIEFAKIRDEALGYRVNKREAAKVACFFCGPRPLAGALRDACEAASNSQVEFSFFKEHF
ncbi:hypothetical protein RI367_006570 [Sorochytrium milnesiophthora]